MTVILAVFGWFLAILTLSTIVRNLYRVNRSPGVKFVLDVVLFIGVVIHELAHASALLCMGVVPKKFIVRYRSRWTGRTSPHGAVGIRESDDLKMTFMQGLFASLAPLFVSTFTFLFTLDVIFNTNSIDLIKLAAGVVMISVVFGSCPSNADINAMIENFHNRPEHSWYQLLLAVISLLIVAFCVDLTFLILPFEVFYYILYCLTSIGVYFGLKITILSLKSLIVWAIHNIKDRRIDRRTILSLPERYYDSELNSIEEVDK
jgi:hypothetical protein